jgi:hypothetical protein
MQFVVAPVLHKYVDDADHGAQSFVDSPRTRVPLPSIRQVGAAVTETVFVHVLEFLMPFVTVTEKFPGLLTEMQRDVAPLLHK